MPRVLARIDRNLEGSFIGCFLGFILLLCESWRRGIPSASIDYHIDFARTFGLVLWIAFTLVGIFFGYIASFCGAMIQENWSLWSSFPVRTERSKFKNDTELKRFKCLADTLGCIIPPAVKDEGWEHSIMDLERSLALKLERASENVSWQRRMVFLSKARLFVNLLDCWRIYLFDRILRPLAEIVKTFRGK